jgi:hypothetical protein
VVVVVGGSRSRLTLVDRRRIALIDDPLPAQPYHAAAEGNLDLDQGAGLIASVEAAAGAAAVGGLGAMAGAARQAGYRPAAVAVVAKVRSIPADLQAILRSHALLHAAEGDLYERALLAGADDLGLTAHRVDATTLELGSHVDALGRVAGPPWQKDHKLAAAAALTILGVGT